MKAIFVLYKEETRNQRGLPKLLDICDSFFFVFQESVA